MRNSNYEEVNPFGIERELKRRLKNKVASRLRARFEHGVLVVTGNVISHEAIQLVDEIIDEIAPTADVDNRVHVRLPAGNVRSVDRFEPDLVS